MIKKQGLSKGDSNIIKGLCMLLIMFHNFFHLIKPNTGENEFDFSRNYFQNFISFISSAPLEFIRHTFSYFGHYGVQLFIFISAYGLYLSYKDRDIQWFSFMKKRISKLYPTLLIGLVFVFILIVLHTYNFPSGHQVKTGLMKLTLLYNFIPNEAISLSGPWWFFSVIVQLYAVFPILLKLAKKYGPNSMLVVAFLFTGITMTLDLLVKIPGLSIYYTFLGQIPIFSLGIYFAARSEIKISVVILLVALVVFSFGNINQYVWYFSFMAVTILLLAIIILLIPLIARFKRLQSFIVFTGSISLFLFVIHGSLRSPFVAIAEKYNNPFLTIALSIAFIGLSYLFAIIIRMLEKQLQLFIDSGYNFKVLVGRVKANEY